jgi:tight adherence protein B
LLSFLVFMGLPGLAPYIVTAIFGILGYFAPELLVRWLKRRRRRMFSEQLVDALIMLSNGLRAGFTLQQAIEMLVEESRPPISQEFELVLREFHFGIDLEKAMVNCAERANNEDLSLAVTAVAICRQVGGNLAEIFDRIVTMVRDRKLIEGKVDALTAQGKMQAMIVALLPWIFAFFCAKINPELTSLLWTTIPGVIAMFVAIFMDIAGYLWVRKLATIKY